jgi:hypothetical protein
MTYQDGGLRHNNPVNVAQWEAQAIWPGSKTDIVLSMGTGTSSSARPSTRGWRGSAIARLYRSFMASLDGQQAWEELQNHLSEERKASYFRFNVEFDGHEPGLDDVVAMRTMRELPIESGDEVNIVNSLVAKQFYFELEHVPYDVDGRYECNGYLHCRLLGCPRAELLGYVWEKLAGFRLQEEEIAILPQRNGSFLCKVAFCVNDLHEKLAISLSGINISGFPTTVAELMRLQGLDNPFGGANCSKKRWYSGGQTSRGAKHLRV